jgi:hypothetical protein
MALQLREVVQRVGSVQLAGVNQTHEQIPDLGAVHRLVEERILAVQDRFLQGALDDVMPRPRLCRVLRVLARPAYCSTVPDAA